MRTSLSSNRPAQNTRSYNPSAHSCLIAWKAGSCANGPTCTWVDANTKRSTRVCSRLMLRLARAALGEITPSWSPAFINAGRMASLQKNLLRKVPRREIAWWGS
jgi:hypothetical protein